MLQYLCRLVAVIIILECIPCSGRISRMHHLRETREMLQLTTGQRLRDYAGYGNYCGIGGHGPVLDPIDMCCKIHDDCYGIITATVGAICEPHKDSYEYSIVSNRLSCVTETSLCGREVCLCDEKLLKCLQINNIYYDPSLRRTSHLAKSVLLASVAFIMGK